MTEIQFCVLSYYPSIMNDENINVGFLFYNLDTKERYLYIFRNHKRLENFDDEIDVDFLMAYLKGVKENWEGSLFEAGNNSSVESFIYNFGNELRFGKIQSSKVEDARAFIEETKKMVFRFDYERAARPSEESIKKYIKKLLKANSIEYSIKDGSGGFSEKVSYDFVVKNYGFKSFLVEDNSDLRRQLLNYKGWAYTALKNRDSSGLETVFVVDSDRTDDSYKTALKILESAARVMKPSEVFPFVQGLGTV